jgi:hypothetical protein
MKVDWHKRSCNRFVPTILQKQPPHADLMTSIMHRRMRIEEMFGDLKNMVLTWKAQCYILLFGYLD